MILLVDADACPVWKQAEKIASDYGIESVLVCDSAHCINSDISKVVTVTKGADSADFALLNMVSKGDIVVTQDYGLAALCKSKGAYAINQNGFEYTDENIDMLLTFRHDSARLRRGGVRLRGPARRTPDMDAAFSENLIKLIESVI